MESKWLSLDKPLFGGEESKSMGAWLLLEGNYDWFMNKFRSAEVAEEEKVPTIPVNIGSPYACSGVAFPEVYIGRVSDILGENLTEIYIKESTDVKGVYLLKNQYVVTFSDTDKHFGSGVRENMLGVLNKYSSALGADIVVSCPHGANSAAETVEGKLYIKFYAIPSHFKKSTFSLSSVFKQDLKSGQMDCMNATGKGVPIIDETTGITVAEIFGGTMFVLFDLPHYNNNIAVILDELMRRYIALDLSPEFLGSYLEELKKKEMLKVKVDYIKECAKRKQTRVIKCQANLVEYESHMAKGQQMITNAIQMLTEVRRELDMLKSDDDATNELYSNEFDQLLALPGVLEVVVENEVVRVFTDTVQIKYGRKTFTIGKFRIDIPTTGRTTIKCHNLTKQAPNGYNHPHVQSDGSCCLGNLTDGIGKLIGQYQFSVVAQIMLQYLGSYNHDDRYEDIVSWG